MLVVKKYKEIEGILIYEGKVDSYEEFNEEVEKLKNLTPIDKCSKVLIEKDGYYYEITYYPFDKIVKEIESILGKKIGIKEGKRLLINKSIQTKIRQYDEKKKRYVELYQPTLDDATYQKLKELAQKYNQLLDIC